MKIDFILSNISQFYLGSEKNIKLALVSLLAKGHLLIEDFPGMGKTLLSQLLANMLGLSYRRVQFTNDLLPSDIIGCSIYKKNLDIFEFIKGPIFTHILLADEINRASPRSQSALLESMAERQVTVEGQTFKLPDPFFVIATQNPSFQIGTHPLPESQLDRFLMKIKLGYPDKENEKKLLLGSHNQINYDAIDPVLTLEELIHIQKEVEQVFVSESILSYLHKILEFTRDDTIFQQGMSIRGGISFLKAIKAWSYINHRSHILLEDVQFILPYVLGHRVFFKEQSIQQTELSDYIIEKVKFIE